MRQEGKLRKARGEKHPASSFAVHSSTKKKNSFIKAIKVLASVPESPSVSTSSTSISAYSFITDSGGDLDPQSFESEPVIPSIIHELEVEEDMATDLRAGFRERQRKRLYEPIEVVTLSTKRSYLDEVHEEPITDASLTPVPPPDAAGSNNAPITASLAKKETCRA